jgi:hypothetical protein
MPALTRSTRVAVCWLATLLWPASGLAATTVANDAADGVRYAGTWASSADAAYYGGDSHISSTQGDTVSLTFSGDFIRWIGTTNPDVGKADVQICDGTGTTCEAPTLADGFAKQRYVQQVRYARYGLTPGPHTIMISVRAHSSGAGHVIDLDAFEYGVALSGDHYIDNRIGSNCSDGGAGTSAAAPWCTFTPINGQTFQADSKILLAQGAVWNQTLGKLYGAGTASSWISIDQYGSGARPKICRNGEHSDRAIWLDNPDYWQISDIEICGTGAGIVSYFSTNGHTGLRFNNIYTHDNDIIHNADPCSWHAEPDLPGMYHGAAILLTGNVPVTENSYAISDVTVSHLESNHDSDPIDIAGFNPDAPVGCTSLGFLTRDLGHHAAGNLQLDHAYLHNAKGAPNFDNLEHLRVLDTRIVSMCEIGQSIGTTSLFLWSVSDVRVTNSVIRDIPATGNADETGTDLEAYNDRVQFRGNLFGYNAGPAIELLSFRATDFNTSHEISSNLFFSNAMDTASAKFAALSFVEPGGAAQTGTARDNLYFEPTGLSNIDGSVNWTFANNVSVAASASNGGDQFASTQGAGGWSYEGFDGVRWSELAYNVANDTWGGPSAGVRRFDTLPGACATCWTARTWLAPSSGTVSVRGHIQHADERAGDGVLARVTRNGSAIWPATLTPMLISSTDDTGMDANLDLIAVQAGDRIRFELNAGALGDNASDTTSWSPSVGYTGLTAAGVRLVGDDEVGTGDAQVDYVSGTWSIAGDVHYNLGNTADASYHVRFSGSQVVVHAGRNTDRGIGAYRICDGDGKNCGAETMVDQYAGELLDDRVVWTSPTLPPGVHTLVVRTTHTKNALSSDYVVDLDRVSISTNGTVVDSTELAFASGEWLVAGRVRYNTGATTTAYYQLRFTGTQIVVHGGRNTDRGIAAYAICDASGANCGAEVEVDQYATTLQNEQVIWTSPILPAVEHTLRVRTTHTKQAAASDYLVDVDSLAVN